jgi:acetyl/propionyl-CoA carboxylase alpha subunit
MLSEAAAASASSGCRRRIVPPLHKLLIANRGEIALRIQRTARAVGLSTVAVFSDADEHAPFVHNADEAVRLPGTAAADTYLRADLIVDAALRTGADAVHPGYGFLSENADFARACETAGLTFVGPPVRAIELMGSKIAAKTLMADAGVPVLPGHTVTGGADTAVQERAAEVRNAAAEIGYPVMVKAAFGGGGRGMRIVRSEDDLVDAVDAAGREALAAFGDGTVFLERYVESPRHVEVQIFGDQHGNVIHLFERECSIQRRHQKIVEESPSPAVDDERRHAICAAAVAAGAAIGYVGAGTVEFVMEPDGRFWFLEVNTRLQVEHPVTELVTGLDLVELQLLVAEGRPLPDAATTAVMRGHAIEVRLYAEDVVAGFVPAGGTLHRFDVPAGDGVRVDSGYAAGSVVGTNYDAMLAKVIAFAPERETAARHLADALARAEIHGVVTNRDLLVRTLRHPEFLSGRTDTGFLERNDVTELGRPLCDEAGMRVHAVAAGVWSSSTLANGAAESVIPTGIPRGWRNVGGQGQPMVFTDGERRVDVVCEPRRSGIDVQVDGQDVGGVVVRGIVGDGVDLEVDGVRRRYGVHRVGDTFFVDSGLGASALTLVDRFPTTEVTAVAGSLLSPMPGTVLAVTVEVGDAVTAGQLLVSLEAMKMEHAIRAPHDGVVSEVLVSPGDQVETAATLVVVTQKEEE